MCRKSSSSFFFGLAVGERVGLSPSTVRPFAASGPRVWRHSRFSPTAYGLRAGRLSVQHFTLHQPKQGHRGLSLVVEGVTSSRPSRHPNSGMSSFARHSASSIAFLPGTGIEAVCGSLQSLEKILPVAGVFWSWPPRACHVKAEDFLLSERRHFAGL